MSKIFKNTQNDTIRADEAPDESWVEIDEAEFAAICESKRVQPDPAIEARAYLASTDWYVTRFVETGKPVPDDVSKKREEARKQAN